MSYGYTGKTAPVRVFRLVVSFELDDTEAKEILRTEYPVVDEDAARAMATARLNKLAEAGYPPEKLVVGFCEVK